MQHLAVLASESHTDPLPALPIEEIVCGARKKTTTDRPSEMSNRSSLNVIP
jgi:hypothetical protein